jgi:hypothetical protein
MAPLIRRSLQAAALLGLMVGAAGRVSADPFDLATPAGLTPGEQFRFVMVTNGTTLANSPDIGFYDTFVNNPGESATYAGATITWRAIGTTATVFAIDHIGQTDTPVYLPDGTLVTTSTTTSGLWSGTLHHAIDEYLNSVPASTGVWTGTGPDGHFPTVSPTFVLGNTGIITAVGLSTSSDGNWIESGNPSPNIVPFFPLYGISQVFTAVPEPSTLWVGAIGAVAFLVFGWSRHRRGQPRQAAA